jgi:hypothetical protein
MVFHENMTFDGILKETSRFFGLLKHHKQDPFHSNRALDNHD